MPPTTRQFRFADFRFDPESGDLTGAGGTTRLQPQVGALLKALVENAGDVVSRSELQERLWPNTTVEFDDGLNTCMRQLRVALGDDANAPRFIETLPKRGYRFLAPVTTEDGTVVGTTPPNGTPAEPLVEAPAPPSSSHAFWWVMAATAFGMAVLIGMSVLARQHRLPFQEQPPERIVLAIAGFAADTTDPMVTAYRSRVMARILSDARSERGWDVVAGDAPAATHVFSGRLTRDGNSVRVFAQVVTVPDRRHIWADDLVDSYAFDGNSTVMAGRIEKTVARALGVIR